MIKAKHQKWAEFIFRLYIFRLLSKNFASVQLLGEEPVISPEKPLLILPNHSTWWDGFFVYLLNKKIFQRDLYLMMLEEQLIKYPFFSKVGAYSIQQGKPKKVIESLQYTLNLFQQKNQPPPLVCIFPQGELKPWGERPLGFESGLDWLLKHASSEIQVLPLAIRVELLEKQKPEVFFKFESVFSSKSITQPASEFLERRMTEILDNLMQEIYAKNTGKSLLEGGLSINSRWDKFKSIIKNTKKH